MKLDFTALAQRVDKTRGQVGTSGTQAFMRAAASPAVGDTVGTRGDNSRNTTAAAVIAVELPVPVTACPPLSPPCPQSPVACEPNGINVSPVSPLVPTKSGQLAAASRDRPQRLTPDDADRCHSPCWNDAEIEAFTARAARFTQLGRADADDLAERLTLRDRDGDDRRLCLECSWLGDAGRCLAAASGRIPGADRRLEPVQTILQRCPAFGLRKGLGGRAESLRHRPA